MIDPVKIAKGHPLDQCDCGDYRRDHKHGFGPCRFNGPGFDLTHGGRDCTSFRLSVRAVLQEKG